jgi:hypothetical protein
MITPGMPKQSLKGDTMLSRPPDSLWHLMVHTAIEIHTILHTKERSGEECDTDCSRETAMALYLVHRTTIPTEERYK